MFTFPSNKKKKKISKAEAQNYLNLNEAFEKIGEKLEGENWEQMRNSHLLYPIVENINDMIKNDFFDVYDGDDSGRRLNGSRKADLLSKITYSDFLTRIRNRYKSFVALRDSVLIPSIKITDSIRDSFANKFEERKSHKKRSNAKKEYTTTVVHDEALEINYSTFFPKNFLIPKEQFDYVLKTGKRWMDQAPKKEYGNLIVSEKQSEFRGLVIHEKMLKIDSRENLLSYIELAALYKIKLKAPDWEIDLWIDLAYEKELIPLRSDEIDKDGYTYFNKQKAGDLNYTKTFYLKSQADSFSPDRFVDYQGLVNLWKKFGISEEKIVQLVSNHLSPSDTQKLLPDAIFFEKYGSLIHPIHKNNHTELPSIADNETKHKFIKEAAFASSYIKAMEDKYFSNLSNKNSLKSKRLIAFKARLESDIKNSPNKKLLPKISYNGGNSYLNIGKNEYSLSDRDIEKCWKEVVVDKLSENHPWRRERRPKNNALKS